MRGCTRFLAVAALLATGALGSSCAPKGNLVTSPQEPGSIVVQEMRAACRGWLRTGGDKHRFEVFYALLPPDNIYAEFAGRIGGTQAILTVRHGRLLVLMPSERQFFEEEATPATFEALFGLRLSPGDLTSVLGSAGLKRTFYIGEGVDRLVVQVDEGYLRAEPEQWKRERGRLIGHGFQGLELKCQEIDRPPAVPVEPGLFDVPIPVSFERFILDPDATSPLLLP